MEPSPAEDLEDAVVAMSARLGDLSAYHAFSKVREEVGRNLRAQDKPRLAVPINVELDATPGVSADAEGCIPITGKPAVGLAVFVEDRVILAWQQGVLRLRTSSTQLPYATISSVKEVIYTRANQGAMGLEVLADDTWHILDSEMGGEKERAILLVRFTHGTYTPTHEVPDAGLSAFDDPGGTSSPLDTLPSGLDVQVVERRGSWARIACPSGDLFWVDGQRLVQLPQNEVADAKAPPAGPPPAGPPPAGPPPAGPPPAGPPPAGPPPS